MRKADRYRQTLRELDAWDDYLLQESRLPGPRGNLELAAAVADEGNVAMFDRYLAYDAVVAPANDPREFLVFCGVLGQGRLLVEGQLDRMATLRRFASDPRWRTREAVAMALQRYGRWDMDALLAEMENWAGGAFLVQRASAAALCEPSLLKESKHALGTLRILDRITQSMLESSDRRNDDYRVLRKGMGYCWSVAVVALPEEGMALMEEWLAVEDPDVRWIMKQNLRKKRLERLDPVWVERWKAAVGM
jgi:hypothetical protein